MKHALQMTQVTVICANVTGLLYDLSLNGITLHHIRMQDELTASFFVRQSHYQLTVALIEASDGRIVESVPASVALLFKSMLRRPVMILGAAMILLLTLLIPTRLLFFEVTGNEQLTQLDILEAAAKCGLKFGAVRRNVRSENIKNHLLAELSELKWVGVNTCGCVAIISVQERATVSKDPDMCMVSSIVASCDGVIREMTVKNGNPQCHIGQAVKKGQLLVSGYSDCGRCIYGTRADAEIYAQTKHTLSISSLPKTVKRGHILELNKKFGLIIGKKRINFYKGSGISDATCVRMYMEYPLTLPGGFQLPVSFCVQEETSYASVSTDADPVKTEAIMKASALTYLHSQMVAGVVVQENYQVTEWDGAVHMLGQYTCDEMISQTRNEEIIINYEQTD